MGTWSIWAAPMIITGAETPDSDSALNPIASAGSSAATARTGRLKASGVCFGSIAPLVG